MTRISFPITTHRVTAEHVAEQIVRKSQELGIDVEVKSYITVCTAMFKSDDDLNLMLVSGTIQELDGLYMGGKGYKIA